MNFYIVDTCMQTKYSKSQGLHSKTLTPFIICEYINVTCAIVHVMQAYFWQILK